MVKNYVRCEGGDILKLDHRYAVKSYFINIHIAQNILETQLMGQVVELQITGQ